ncbi:MAG: D-sedoheptulose 7-phosphate isomerase [Lewinellaceae bacterium]|nr:D-sedoheptulose 7-phosphate isomerase [Saprospiraceae bacterium]MCB9314750.1 D-sedoheptulose 7-phosphate isomerase [Lewinellaceae bacterium]MCB9333159.1 D-sedoheptulose 7-phosphate isomerase [Lewinellaceae bacterium]
MNTIIEKSIRESIAVKQALLTDRHLLEQIEQAAQLLTQTFRAGGKVLFCGNGGSAADAQHIAAELSGRFYSDRAPLFAEALHVNSSYLTAVANDYGYEQVFARMVEAAGRPGDVLVAISTSGNSASILRAVEKATAVGMAVVGMTGTTGGKMAGLCQVLLNVPSADTPRIQEAHILIGHMLCQIVEQELFGE